MRKHWTLGGWNVESLKPKEICYVFISCTVDLSEGRSLSDVKLMNLQKHMPVPYTHAQTHRHTYTFLRGRVGVSKLM